MASKKTTGTPKGEKATAPPPASTEDRTTGTDKVAMVSVRADGSADQTDDYEILTEDTADNGDS